MGFDAVDRNGDKRWDQDEFMMSMAGGPPSTGGPSGGMPGGMEDQFKMMDRNGDNRVSYDEYSETNREQLKMAGMEWDATMDQALRMGFEMIDQNRDEHWEFHEFSNPNPPMPGMEGPGMGPGGPPPVNMDMLQENPENIFNRLSTGDRMSYD